ncbi:molecular chaperone DnaJ [Theileria orientalis]|uniref:Molecular chaperone DnaJ n=1 Tax=Theileria orientalis TaxID=68886 RepID=A0A976SK36_THEOR|nr:molecular chaperone DnaJ [Theileria orientalis]
MVSYISCASPFIACIVIRYLNLKSVNSFSFGFGNDFFDFQPPPDKSYDDKKCPYEVLGVDKNSTHKEIRKAFLALSKKYHPDLNTDEDASDKFKELNEAYEILSNNDKREAYDNHGFAGLDRMEQMGGMPEEFEMDDLFSSFFGSGGFQGARAERKADPVVYPLSVPLDYFYTGKDLEMTVELTRLCKNYDECETKRSDCQGPGVKVVTQQRGYGMFIQHQMRDETCLGRGKGWKPNCQECPDGPTHKEHIDVTVSIEPGIRNKQNIIMEGRGQERPGVKRGDLVFVITEKQHEVYKRDGNDLHCKVEISLKESLTSFKRDIDVFGELKFIISHKGVTPPGHIFKVEGKGMPIHNTDKHGNLYVTINVQFPKKLTPEQEKLIEQALE